MTHKVHQTDQDDIGDASPPRRPRHTAFPLSEARNSGGHVSDASPPRRTRATHERRHRPEASPDHPSDASPPHRPRTSIRDRRQSRFSSVSSLPSTRSVKARVNKQDSAADPLAWRVKQSRDGSDNMGGGGSPLNFQNRSKTGGESEQVGSVRSSAKLDAHYEPPRKLSRTDAASGSATRRPRLSFNRYNIDAGPRWDGIDRSNGFEHRLERKKAERADAERLAYAQSVFDM